MTKLDSRIKNVIIITDNHVDSEIQVALGFCRTQAGCAGLLEYLFRIDQPLAEQLRLQIGFECMKDIVLCIRTIVFMAKKDIVGTHFLGCSQKTDPEIQTGTDQRFEGIA